MTGTHAAVTYNQMVVQTESTDDEVDRIFRALADATRRDILRRTLTGEATVSQLAAAYDMSFAAVQKHVAVLERAGLVSKHRQGRERIVRGEPERIRRAQALLERYEQIWRGRVAQLDALLAED
ncbi:metalloregulator ArsR/SmtB family transcription factor [Microbacterium petrolearium]